MTTYYFVRQNDGVALKELGNDCGHARTFSRATIIHAMKVLHHCKRGEKLGIMVAHAYCDSIYIRYSDSMLYVDYIPVTGEALQECRKLLNIWDEDLL